MTDVTRRRAMEEKNYLMETSGVLQSEKQKAKIEEDIRARRLDQYRRYMSYGNADGRAGNLKKDC